MSQTNVYRCRRCKATLQSYGPTDAGTCRCGGTFEAIEVSGQIEASPGPRAETPRSRME
jgi:DNA-directed RNA polymerase subunit RPC12/RpoP